MDIQYFETLGSTQTALIEALERKEVKAPLAFLSRDQTQGRGSRENSWVGGEGNFFASIAVEIATLPKDLPLGSASIYFSFIMKEVLEILGEKVWLKWPNDFYKGNAKVGGVITQKRRDILVCGIGINLKNFSNTYSALQSDISAQFLLEKYLIALEKFPLWKQIFRKYQIEFELSREFSVHIEDKKKSLSQALLCEDGSLILEGVKVFSLR